MDTELGDKLEMRVGIKESNITPNFLLMSVSSKEPNDAI